MNFRDVKKQVEPSPGRKEVLFQNVVTDDIIEVILYADSKLGEQTKKAAHLLRGKNSLETCRNIWDFVRSEVKYKKDRPGDEIIKSPSRTLQDGFGDCKSFSLLEASFLKNLGISYRYRFTGYPGDKWVSHVYVVAEVEGKEIILDGTYNRFNSEVPFKFGYDYHPGGKKEAINGNGNGLNFSQNILKIIGGFFLIKILLNAD